MSYTHPNGQPQGTAHEITNKLRELLIGEIIAINGYQSHIENSNIEDINNEWQKIMEDEKKHYGMLLGLLRKYDPEEYKSYLEHKTALPDIRAATQKYVPNLYNQIILNNIRYDIKGELEAVILYEEELTKFTHKDIRDAVKTIIKEEKGHTEHLTRLLLKYDPDRYDELE